jgi:hypothetical protein
MFQHLVASTDNVGAHHTMKSSSPLPPKLPMLRKKAESFVESAAGVSPFLRLANLVEKTTTQAAKVKEDGSRLPLINHRTISKENEEEPSSPSPLLPPTQAFNPHAIVITAPPIEAVKCTENDKIPPNRIGEALWSSSCWSCNDNIINPQVDPVAIANLGKGTTYQQRRKKRRDSWDTTPPEGVIETPDALKLRVRRWLLKKGVPGVPGFDERFKASWSPNLLRVTPLHEVIVGHSYVICLSDQFILLYYWIVLLFPSPSPPPSSFCPRFLFSILLKKHNNNKFLFRLYIKCVCVYPGCFRRRHCDM